ncbi:MAG: LLM class flavin-dependent oxidoreductase [Actinomycetota bacterium]
MDGTPADGSGRVGFALREALPWRELVQVVETGERTGYEAVFVPEIAGREAFATLAGLAVHTTVLRLGTGVVTAVARGLSVTAMGAATVHELSGGRMILGLGTGRAGPGALERLRGSRSSRGSHVSPGRAAGSRPPAVRLS